MCTVYLVYFLALLLKNGGGDMILILIRVSVGTATGSGGTEMRGAFRSFRPELGL